MCVDREIGKLLKRDFTFVTSLPNPSDKLVGLSGITTIMGRGVAIPKSLTSNGNLALGLAMD
jgi:hypothetical protein